MIDAVTALNARDDWLWIVHHWGDLQARLRPDRGDPNAPKVSRTVEHPPLPIDPHVSDVILEITELAGWYGTALIKEGSWIPRDGELDMPRRLAKVAELYGHFTADDREALDYCDSAHEFRSKVEGILNRKEPTRYVGPCPEDGCGGELYMAETEGGVCPECGEPWTLPAQFAYLRAEAEDVLMERDVLRTALVSMGYDVPFETIKTWTKRAKIEQPEPGLYRFGDALGLAKKRGERKVSVR